jgi:peroxiredoxin
MRSLFALLLLAVVFPAVARSTPSESVLNFALLDHQGRMQELRRMDASVVVLFFTANECPIARQCATKLNDLQARFAARGVRVLLVNANSGDDRKSINRESRELGIWHLPTLKDDTQGVARHLGVRRTGEALAISTKDWTVFYRGALDDQLVEGASKPQPSERYLETALDQFLGGQPVTLAKTVARGCVIHFDGGNGPDSAAVSYTQDVVPILASKCVSCHSPGNIGPWAMTSHRKVKGMASMIEEVLLTRRMPPWDADPHVGKFANDASLTVAEAQTLLRWVHQGAVRGEGPDPLENLKVPVTPEWPLGQPDLVLRLPSPQQIPANGVLDYRHVEVLAGNANEAWVGAVYVKAGNRKVLHHIIARIKEQGEKDHLGQDEMFVGWAPGSTQEWYPKGAGKFLPKNAKFDLELHYTTCGSPQTDATEIGLYLLKEPPTHRYESVPVVNFQFEIQPGDPDSPAQGLYCFPEDAVLHGVTPHMHLRGKWMRFELLQPDGKREVVGSIPRYDFNWQFTYEFAKPRKLTRGTWAVLNGGFDNSARNPANPDPKKAVHWGEQSWDEMFLGWYNVTWELPKPSKKSGGTAGGAP